MNKLKFGSYIKESRIKKNYTQQELANLLFVDVTTVSKWERGVSYPDITLVPDICRVLEISEHELIQSSKDEEYRKMKKDANKYNNMKKSTFWTLNICYFVAILTCFIVNIAVNHTLSWFFIVLTSIVCSYTFCPTITWLFTKYKKLVFLGSTFASMSLLFLTCSLYTSNYWFMIAILGVLLGYFIAFYPILFNCFDKNKRYFLFTYIFGIFILIVLLLISIYLYVPIKIGMTLLITGGIFVIPMAFGVLNLFEISKSLNKPILLSLAGVFVILLVICIGRAIYLKSTEASKTYIVEETYNDIKISGTTIDIDIYLSNDGNNKVVYTENKRVSVKTEVTDGVLSVSQDDNRKFYDMLFNFTGFEVELYLTQETINSLEINGKTGDINIHQGLKFNNIAINNSTGDIDFESKVTNNMNINNSTGDIEIRNSTINGNLNIETSTGDVELEKVNCNKLDIKVSTGDIELTDTLVAADLNVEGSTGDVDFDGFDAANIYVTVKTGDVKGTLLTSKIFIANSKTGTVRVPETLTGGVCKIVTGTGNIVVSYK